MRYLMRGAGVVLCGLGLLVLPLQPAGASPRRSTSVFAALVDLDAYPGLGMTLLGAGLSLFLVEWLVWRRRK